MRYYIVGLGNPGEKYADTRHNVGRFVVEAYLREYGLPDFEKRKEHKALVSRGVTGRNELVLMEPDNYMNNSGESLRKIDDLHDEDTRLIVVHDDIDLPIGEMRISVSRGAGGHNGVSSIIEHYGSKHFIRIRIGIAPTTFFGAIKKPRGEVAVQKYVLSKFSSREGKIISNVVIKAVDAISIIQEQGAEKAMNTFN